MTKAISLDTVKIGKGEAMIPMSQTYSPALKQQVVREARETGNAALVARQHPWNPAMVRRWVREALTAEYPDPHALS
jgi:transposase-like protein